MGNSKQDNYPKWELIGQFLLLCFLTTMMSLLLSGCGQPGQIAGQMRVMEMQQPSPSPAPSPVHIVAEPIPEPEIPVKEKEKHSQDVILTETTQTDVLIVVDNSASMRFEQANMAERFGSLLDEMKSLDWRLGIVTTDMSGNAPRKDGRLLEFKGLPDTFYLDSSMPEDVVKTAFAGTIQRPSREGNANEQGIKATYRALERDQKMFRNEGSLNVVVVTDADETPIKGTKPDLRNNPNELVKYVNTKFPGKPFYFHSIIVKENDEACLKVDDNEAYGRTYAWLSQKTGGIIGNVCEKDYSAQLKMIGEKVSQKVKSVTLQCAPVEGSIQITNNLGHEIPKYVVQENVLNFEESLPVGHNRLDYECFK